MSESVASSQTPNLDLLYPVSTEQAAEFQRNGHILLRGIASAREIEFFRPVIDQAAKKYNKENRDLKERDTYGKAFSADNKSLGS